MLTDPKAALAGVILEISFARFMASIAIFSEEMVPSRPLDRWGLAAIVETQVGGCEKEYERLITMGDRPVMIGHVRIHFA